MTYQRPVWTEIDLKAIEHNVKLLRETVGQNTLLMAVVKADGYGHGAIRVARKALESGVDRLGVALVEEALELREGGIASVIHLLSEAPPEAASYIVNNNLIATLYSKEAAEELSRIAKLKGKNVLTHIKVDTGMNRIGLKPEDTLSFFEFLQKLPNLKVEGIFTHFALADNSESSFTQEQFRKFNEVLSTLKERGLDVSLKHAANSAATFLFKETHLDMVRIGISLYGLHPSAATKGKVSLKPALSLKAKVSWAKEVGASEGISYGHTYHTKEATNIVTLPLGYGDGYSRLLSNRSSVLLKGKRFPSVGTICMDQLMVDVGEKDIKVGDEAVLIGKQGEEEVSADELAKILGTINYEIVCMVGRRVPRVYIK